MLPRFPPSGPFPLPWPPPPPVPPTFFCPLGSGLDKGGGGVASHRYRDRAAACRFCLTPDWFVACLRCASPRPNIFNGNGSGREKCRDCQDPLLCPFPTIDTFILTLVFFSFCVPRSRQVYFVIHIQSPIQLLSMLVCARQWREVSHAKKPNLTPNVSGRELPHPCRIPPINLPVPHTVSLTGSLPPFSCPCTPLCVPRAFLACSAQVSARFPPLPSV